MTVDAITLFDREDGPRSMKLGRYDGTTYLDDDDNEIQTEDAEIVELEEPASKAEILSTWDTADFPARVREFFGVDVDAADDPDADTDPETDPDAAVDTTGGVATDA